MTERNIEAVEIEAAIGRLESYNPRVNAIACLLTVGGLWLATSAWTAPRQAPQTDVAAPPNTCDFALASTAPDVLVKAVDAVAKLVKIPPPQGDPVVFTEMDLSALNLQIQTTPPLRFTWSGAYSLQVMNVSDRTVTRVSTDLHLGWDNGEGTGRGGQFVGELMPGERALIEVKDRVSHGGPFLRTDAFHLSPQLLSVDFDGCRYRRERFLQRASTAA